MKNSVSLWSETQLAAFERLTKIGETFFCAQLPQTGIRPRLDPLVVGSSGSGKTFLARAVANHLEVPLIKLTFGEWLVAGARSCSIATVELVRQFIDGHERGIIQIDELDKARAGFQREWSIAAYAELFSLLDRSTAEGNLGARWEPIHAWRSKMTSGLSVVELGKKCGVILKRGRSGSRNANGICRQMEFGIRSSEGH